MWKAELPIRRVDRIQQVRTLAVIKEDLEIVHRFVRSRISLSNTWRKSRQSL